MTLLDSPGVGHIGSLDFVEIPEVSRHALPDLFAELKERQAAGATTIGAHLVRDAGWQSFENWLDMISDVEMDKGMPWTDPDPAKPGFVSDWSEFHQDDESRPIHPMTAHYSEGAPLRTIILEGSEPIAQPDVHFPLAKLVLPKTMYRRGTYDARYVTPPSRALTAEIRNRDMLIFDHRQPHAFQKIGRKSRKSWAQYVNDFLSLVLNLAQRIGDSPIAMPSRVD